MPEEKIKIFENEVKKDIKFPELLSYEELLYTPDKLEDVNKDEGDKLGRALDPSVDTSDDLPEGATNKYLLDLAVTEIKLAAQAVTNAKIAVNAIQGDVIAAAAITETKIAPDSVSTAKLQAASVIAGKIAAGAVTTEKIYALAITTEKIAAGAVTSAKVTTGELITLSAQIKNAIITDAKISDLTVEKLTGTYLTGKFVRTALSGERVEMQTSIGIYPHNISFYNTAGTFFAQIGRINSNNLGIQVIGDLVVKCNLTPVLSASYNLGSSSYKWQHLYLSGNINMGNRLYFPASDSYIHRGTVEYFKLESGQIVCTKDFVPISHNQGDLGKTDRKWHLVAAVETSFGDINFENKFRITEEGKTGLAFFNQNNKKITILDEEGNWFIKGQIKQL